jgi:hypothetical protein
MRRRFLGPRIKPVFARVYLPAWFPLEPIELGFLAPVPDHNTAVSRQKNARPVFWRRLDRLPVHLVLPVRGGEQGRELIQAPPTCASKLVVVVLSGVPGRCVDFYDQGLESLAELGERTFGGFRTLNQ